MIAQQVICLVLQQWNSIFKFSDFVVYLQIQDKITKYID